jgi:hypothetical protein
VRPAKALLTQPRQETLRKDPRPGRGVAGAPEPEALVTRLGVAGGAGGAEEALPRVFYTVLAFPQNSKAFQGVIPVLPLRHGLQQVELCALPCVSWTP